MSSIRAATHVLPEGFTVMDSYSPRLALPKNWPRNVKTAVVQVIALAHVAIVHARRLVLDSPNARTRLDGDLQRAMDEISRPGRQKCTPVRR